MGVRRLAAVVVVAACAGVSARLWSDALTPTTSPYIEPFSAPGALDAAPQIVVVPTAKPPTSHRAAKVVPKTNAKGAGVGGTPIVRSGHTHTPVAPAAKPPAKPKPPAPHAPPPVTTPPAPTPPAPTPTPPTPAPIAAPAPSPPAPTPPAVAVPITPPATPAPPVVPPVTPPPVQQPADTSRPGNGYGDKNHTHSGPPGQPGK